MPSAIGYVDSSFFIGSIVTRLPRAIIRELDTVRVKVSHHLIEAEIASCAHRERLSMKDFSPNLEKVRLLFPLVTLNVEIKEVLEEGYLRGADLLHLASALWFAGSKTKEVAFLTLDVSQGRIAKALGFHVIGI